MSDNRGLDSHDRIRMLCALAEVGEAEPEELAQVRDHLRRCSSCRKASQAYRKLLFEWLPRADPGDADVPSGEIGRLRREFETRLNEELPRRGRIALHPALLSGRQATLSAAPEGPRSSGWGKLLIPLAAMLVLAALSGSFWQDAVRWRQQAQEARDRSVQLAQTIEDQGQTIEDQGQEIVRLQREISDSPAQPEGSATVSSESVDGRARFAQHEAEIEALWESNQLLIEQSCQAELRSQGLQGRIDSQLQELRRLGSDLRLLQSRNEALHVQIDQREAMLQDMQRRLTDLRNASTSTRYSGLVSDALGERSLRVRDINNLFQRGGNRFAYGRVVTIAGQPTRIFAYGLGQDGEQGNPRFQVWALENFEPPEHVLALRDPSQSAISARWLGELLPHGTGGGRWSLESSDIGSLDGFRYLTVLAIYRNDRSFTKSNQVVLYGHLEE